MSRKIGEELGPPPGLSKGFDRTFRIGLWLKGIDGVFEIIGGLLLLVVSPSDINRIVQMLTVHELSQDPNDIISNFLIKSTSTLNSGTTLFGAIYLLSHGISKVILTAMVLRGKLSAYPWLIALIVTFIAYQLYVIILVRFSWGLSALTVFDVFLVWLTWREYEARKQEQRLA